MATQGERQEFLWRPNDNSATTLTRYSQEAEHWTKAFKSIQASEPGASGGIGFFGVVGLALNLAFSLILLLFLALKSLIIWFSESRKPKVTFKGIGCLEGEGYLDDTGYYIPTEDELNERYGSHKPKIVRDIYK